MSLNFTPSHTPRRVGEWCGFTMGAFLFASVAFLVARHKAWLPTESSYRWVVVGVIGLCAAGFRPAAPCGFAATQAVSFWQGGVSGMRRFGRLVTTVINTALLTIVYFLGVGLTAGIARLAGRRFLDVGASAASASHWQPLDLGTRPAEEYCRQF